MVFERRGGHLRAGVLVLMLAPALASCSDNGDSGTGSTTTTAPPGTANVTPPADRPADPAAAQAEITRNWTAFFDPKTPAAERVKLLEDGERMQAVLGAFGGDKNAAMTSAKVTGVEFTSATGANVTYDLLVGGNPALPGAKGTSVLQNDTWKVSVKTLCGLVELSGVTVPGC
ncbi:MULTISPECIES: hypothetical protein [unclassified Streptomyces]|uniref:hypothetical protein n=1 Tax=unclassified Streptomyces TaxID=2593676 RepID=UPI0007015817|nr:MULTISPECIES: hypothetical protein [unclassified Streptomyces]KQX55000.1 hypothetical protein ASD33_32005 [Streptomyces sp. Root1304]KRA94518.1 hypothetical protein ASE09_31790 [Streptomyces sp. Root66D1]